MSTRTEHGFSVGAAEVVCVAETGPKGYEHAIVWVQTGHTRREIIVTPKGRKITVSEPLPPVSIKEPA